MEGGRWAKSHSLVSKEADPDCTPRVANRICLLHVQESLCTERRQGIDFGDPSLITGSASKFCTILEGASDPPRSSVWRLGEAPLEGQVD